MGKSKHFFGILKLLFIGIFTSCNNQIDSDRIFFGGQIVNPSSTYVTLYKDNKTIDSLALNLNYRFFKYYDSLESGVYKIEHISEYKSVFLEKGDSIWARINASSFDESIVFSGHGAAKNNFMMDLLLSFDKENSFLSSKYSSDSQTFTKLIDSLLVEKKNKWIFMDSINQLSPIAQKITQAAYIYPYANRLERYALIRGKAAVKADSLYFNYRKFLNFAEPDLAFFEPYITYLMSYLSQEALEEGQNFFQEKRNTEFNIKRLELIFEKINHPLLRNILARAVAYEELLNFRNHAYHERFLQFYLSLNSSPLYQIEILGLHRALIQMEPGQPLPEVQLENHLGEILPSSNALSGRPTVLYFWSQTQMNHFKRTQERVKRYQAQFPNYRFVGICIQPYNDLVRNYQEIMGIDPADQLALVNFEEVSNEWVITLLNKGIILDKKGVILDGFANFSATNFPEQLSQLSR